MAPGVIIVKGNPNHPELDEETFNKWYSEQHIQDVCDSGLSDLAIRYKNLDPSAKWRYLAIYRVPDLSKLQDTAFMDSIRKDSPLLPGKEKGSKGGRWPDVLEIEMTYFECIQRFEGQRGSGKRAEGVTTVGMEPQEGTDEEFERWYRLQHLDMMSMCNGYERSTRYKKLDETSPRYLAFHEYATTDFPIEQLKLVTGTEWCKQILSGAQRFERERWEYITEYRTGGSINL